MLPSTGSLTFFLDFEKKKLINVGLLVIVPGSGSIFQEKLGLNNIGVLDIRQGCSGFTYALTVYSLSIV